MCFGMKKLLNFNRNVSFPVIIFIKYYLSTCNYSWVSKFELLIIFSQQFHGG